MRDIPPALKWLGALAGMVLVIAITVPMALNAIGESIQIEDAGSPLLNDGDEDVPDLPDAQEAVLDTVEDGMATALADLSGRDDAVRQADESFVAIGGLESDAVYFAFPLIDGDPACVAEATLELTLIQGTATTLGVYPADVPDILELGDGDPLPAEPFLSEGPRAIAETDGTAGVLFWEVTGLYRDWAAGAYAGETDPFVVAVRPIEYGDIDLRAQFASVEAGEEEAGRLAWSGAPDCP